jgi:hypothetical protein
MERVIKKIFLFVISKLLLAFGSVGSKVYDKIVKQKFHKFLFFFLKIPIFSLSA